jgi:hypothetical protein
LNFNFDGSRVRQLVIPFDTRLQKIEYIKAPERTRVVDQIVDNRLLESRKMIDTYLRLIGNYNTNFYDAVISLE